MSEDSRPLQMTETEAGKLKKLLEVLRPRNDGIRIGSGVGTWVAIAVGIVNLAGVVYYGGKFTQRVEVLERARDEQAAINREVSSHSVQIAVTVNQLENIKQSVARIESAVTK